SYFKYFFFQAEDGIRDGHVTGVQTCALPISDELAVDGVAELLDHLHVARFPHDRLAVRRCGRVRAGSEDPRTEVAGAARDLAPQIGRASCRERGESGLGGDRLTEVRREHRHV